MARLLRRRCRRWPRDSRGHLRPWSWLIPGGRPLRRRCRGSACYTCPRLPGMKLPRLRAPPPPWPAPAPLVVPVTLAVCAVVLNVAPVATPLPSTVSVTGLVRPKFWQFRLPNEPLSLAARKLARLLPSAGTGEAVPASRVASSFSLGVWTLTMFWQYRAAFWLVFVRNGSGGWS